MIASTGNALPDAKFWSGRRVLLTGHTGFKGAWLAHWLRSLDAELLGLSLPGEPTAPSLWSYLGLDAVREIRTDIVGHEWVPEAAAFAPEIILHLAAQSLVAEGYRQPAMTFDVNVMGTSRVLEFASQLPDLLATVVITTDKVYDARQTLPHDESHYFGGADPYAASKAAAELVVGSWPSIGSPRATARAGNVIGGGDWAAERLVPDIVRAWSDERPVTLRNPTGVRPWQHVLEPLRGYLVLAEALAAGTSLPSGLNFGPAGAQSASVHDLVEYAMLEWQRVAGAERCPGYVVTDDDQFRETVELTLDSTLAAELLGWSGVLHWREAVTLTLEWYHAQQRGIPVAKLMDQQLESYAAKVRGSL